MYYRIDVVFSKHKIDIPREAIDAVMHCQNGAAIRFVENIYTLLTKNQYVLLSHVVFYIHRHHQNQKLFHISRYQPLPMQSGPWQNHQKRY